jgi:hypothetical protein
MYVSNLPWEVVFLLQSRHQPCSKSESRKSWSKPESSWPLECILYLPPRQQFTDTVSNFWGLIIMNTWGWTRHFKKGSQMLYQPSWHLLQCPGGSGSFPRQPYKREGMYWSLQILGLHPKPVYSQGWHLAQAPGVSQAALPCAVMHRRLIWWIHTHNARLSHPR